MSSINVGLLEKLMSSEDKDFYKTLGKRVADMRKLNHLTQVQMAKMLSVSQQQIAAFESGRVKIPISALPILSDLFSTTVDDIVGVMRKTRRGPASRMQQQVELISHLPRSKQKFVIEILDTLILQSKMMG